MPAVFSFEVGGFGDVDVGSDRFDESLTRHAGDFD